MFIENGCGRGALDTRGLRFYHMLGHLVQLSSASSADQDLSSSPQLVIGHSHPSHPTTTIMCLESQAGAVCLYVSVQLTQKCLAKH